MEFSFKANILFSLNHYANQFLPCIEHETKQGNHMQSCQYGIRMHEVQMIIQMIELTPEQPLSLDDKETVIFLASLGGFEGDE